MNQNRKLEIWQDVRRQEFGYNYKDEYIQRLLITYTVKNMWNKQGWGKNKNIGEEIPKKNYRPKDHIKRT